MGGAPIPKWDPIGFEPWPDDVKFPCQQVAKGGSGWTSKLNGNANPKARRLSGIIMGEKVETMINGIAKCDKYDTDCPDAVKNKVISYRRVTAANIIALLKDSGCLRRSPCQRISHRPLVHTGPSASLVSNPLYKGCVPLLGRGV